MASGGALTLGLKTWSKLGLQDLASQPFHAVVFSKAKAMTESKLGFGRDNASILRRDDHRCQYLECTRPATTVDHVIPWCQGGPSTWMNLVACCRECNAWKGGTPPVQGGMQLRSHVWSQRALLIDRFHELGVARFTPSPQAFGSVFGSV